MSPVTWTIIFGTLYPPSPHTTNLESELGVCRVGTVHSSKYWIPLTEVEGHGVKRVDTERVPVVRLNYSTTYTTSIVTWTV